MTSVLNGKREQNQGSEASAGEPKGDRKVYATPGIAAQELLKIQETLDSRLSGLETASNHFVAQVLANEAKVLDRNADELAEAIETYRSPQMLIALAYLKATQRLADNKAVKKYLPPNTSWQFSLPSVDTALDYSHLDLRSEDPQSKPSRQIAASTEQNGNAQVLNGNRAATAGKGFSDRQSS